MAEATATPTSLPTIIKEGHVSVRGHFMWRDRYVVVEHGRVTIQRSGRGAIKAKIDLLDATVKVVFHEDTTHLTIAHQAQTTVFDCGSAHDRDAWVSALFTARGGHSGDTDCELSDVVLSSMEEFDKELSTRHGLENGTTATDLERLLSDDETSDQDYNDTMLAFQDLRSSLMLCQRSLINDTEDEDDHPSSPSCVDDRVCTRRHPHGNEAAVKLRNLTAIIAFIHTVQHGGRAVLLHLDVVASVGGISLEEILTAMGDKQRDAKQSTSSALVGLQKLHVATFVRYILFHPVYAKRPDIQHRIAAIDALVDRHFPHCRLRRFSHDLEQGASGHAFELDASWQRKDSPSSSPGPLHAARVAPVSLPTKPSPAALKKKRHSFPNILLPLQIGSLVMQPSLARVDNSAFYDTPLQPKRSRSDHVLAEQSDPTTTTKHDSDLFSDELVPEPLRTVLWKYSCQQIAEQLSIFHQHQLAQLTLWEFVQTPKHAAKATTDHFNRLVSYLVWSVLVEDTAKDRAEVMESIITIATAASAAPLFNFHLVMACVGCLGDMPLMPSRLPLTWKRVRSKFKTQLVALRTLCDHTGGFETLRKRQASESSKGSCIPFIGVIGVTLERLRLVPSTTEPLGLLDLDKFDRQYLAVSAIENAILRPYKFQDIDELQQWAGTKLTAMDAFVSPRLLQLRSQQLLASETIQQSGSRHSSLYRSRNTSGSTAAATNGGSDCGSDGGPPLLPFREICSLLVSTRDVTERMHVCVEALLADDQQPLAQRIRKFHHDFKQSACCSACHVVLASVRNCVDAIKRDLLGHKSFEIMQLTGLDDSAIQLERGLYVALHQAISRPIATWLFTKVRHTFADEDARLCGFLGGGESGRQRSRCGSLDKTGQSPLDLLQSLAEAFEDMPQNADQTTHLQWTREVLSMWTKAPFSVLCLLQQSLDLLFLPRELRDPLELLDSALSTLGGNRRLSRASMLVACTSHGSSVRRSTWQPLDRVVVDVLK